MGQGGEGNGDGDGSKSEVVKDDVVNEEGQPYMSEALVEGDDAGEVTRQEEAKALDSITDHVEEKQLDAQRTKDAMAALSNRQDQANREREERERELAKVRILEKDVDLIADEFEVR